MAYSVIYASGDGVTDTFAISYPLGFISRSDVTCRVGSEVDGLGNPVYRTLTWITDGLVKVNGTVPPVGTNNIAFYRTVSKTSLVHDYADGVAITEQHLDESNLQLIMLLHEILDDRLRVLPASNWDMNAKRIVNLSDGVYPNDAVTVQQAALAIELTPAAVQAAADAAAARSDAEAAKDAAEDYVSAAAQAVASITIPLPIESGGTASTTASGARAALGLGTAATQESSAFDVAGAASAARADAEAYTDTQLSAAQSAANAYADAAASGVLFAKASLTNLSSTNPTISNDKNIASVTRKSAGIYSVVFTTAASAANYIVFGSCAGVAGRPDMIISNVVRTVSGFTFLTITSGNSAVDCDSVNLGVIL